MGNPTYLEIDWPWYGIQFLVDHCQLGPKLFTSNKCRFLQMFPRKQLLGYSSAIAGSKWSVWLILQFICLNMTFYCHWTIANSSPNGLPQVNVGFFKCLQGSSWRAIPACSDCSEWAIQLTLRLIGLDMAFDSQLTIVNSGPNCLPLTNVCSFKHF